MTSDKDNIRRDKTAIEQALRDAGAISKGRYGHARSTRTNTPAAASMPEKTACGSSNALPRHAGFMATFSTSSPGAEASPWKINSAN